MKSSTLKMKGNWDIIKGKLKQKYATLTDNDLRSIDDQEDEIVGRLEKLTGARREEPERIIYDGNDAV